MDRILRAYFDKTITANREQQLIVTDSKHMYCTGEHELIRYQKKDLDPRTCGKRQMLTKVIVVDVDTGILYGELYPREEIDDLDLAGFLARAWATKKDHPMRGSPKTLSLPKRVYDSEHLMSDVKFVAQLARVNLVSAEGGFGPATVAAREYERTIMSQSRPEGHLYAALRGANLVSILACMSAMQAFSSHWKNAVPLSEDFLLQMDAAYKTAGAWRLEPYNEFIIR